MKRIFAVATLAVLGILLVGKFVQRGNSSVGAQGTGKRTEKPLLTKYALSADAGSISLLQTKQGVPAAYRKQLLAAAEAHKVSIKAEKIVYVDNQKMTMVRAPIKGIEKYSEADFCRGRTLRIDGYQVKVQACRAGWLVRSRSPVSTAGGFRKGYL